MLEIGRAEHDVARIDDLIRLERFWNEPVQLLHWLDDYSPIAEGEYRLLLHAAVALVVRHEGAKCGPRIPMPRHLPEPRQPRLLVFRIRLEVGDHLASTLSKSSRSPSASCSMARMSALISSSVRSGCGL